MARPLPKNSSSYDSRQYYRLHVYSLIAAGICDVFLLMDRIAFPDVFWLFVLCRLGIVTPVAILVNLFLHRLSPRVREMAVLLATVLSSDGIFYPTSRSISELAPFYMFCGGCMLLVFSNVVMRLRFWNAVICSTFVWIDMSYRLSQVPAASSKIVACSIFLVAMTAMLTLLATYGMEKDERGYLMSEQKRAIALGAGGRLFWEADLSARIVTFEGPDLTPESSGFNDFYEMLHPDDRALHASRVKDYCEGRTQSFHCEYRIRGEDGSWRWREASGRAVEFDRAGKPSKLVGNSLDVTERKELYQRLEDARQSAERARQTAEQAVRARGEFLANMSHEIRTPMNAVVGMTSLLLDQELPVEARDYVNVIRSSSDSLLTIINDILDFSKIESGKLELENTPFSLHDCIEDAAELLAAKAAEKRIEMAVNIEGDLADFVSGDSTRLKQILVNLIANAVKFTESGEVVVDVARTNAGDSPTLDISVRDTGIGIPADRLKAVFHAFTQADASTTRRFGGTGLGLAISSRLVNLMGGSLRVESEPGVGSTFGFSIPYRPAPGQDLEPAAALGWPGRCILALEQNPATRKNLAAMVSQWRLRMKAVASSEDALNLLRESHWDILLLDLDGLDVDAGEFARAALAECAGGMPPILLLTSNGNLRNPIAETGAVIAPLTKPVRRKQLYRTLAQMLIGVGPEIRPLPAALDRDFARRVPLRILLAEDNPVNQKVASLLLQRLGYRPDVVANGFEVLESIRRQAYDLILLDVQMPEMDGLEAARRIRDNTRREDRPWLTALTAGAMQADRDEAMAAGMDDYLTKPLNVAALQAALERCYVTLGRGSLMPVGS